jgi:hypothetical protein
MKEAMDPMATEADRQELAWTRCRGSQQADHDLSQRRPDNGDKGNGFNNCHPRDPFTCIHQGGEFPDLAFRKLRPLPRPPMFVSTLFHSPENKNQAQGAPE